LIGLLPPDPDAVEAYLQSSVDADPTYDAGAPPPRGYRHVAMSRVVGHGREDFARAKGGIVNWVAHQGSGMVVRPHAPIRAGETVTVLTRQLGLYLLAACRIHAVVDTPTSYGFTYVTLPGHPECGAESFTVTLDGDDTDGTVRFDIEAWSRPEELLVRLSGPLGHLLQRRATSGYLRAMHRWVSYRNGTLDPTKRRRST
jgi:uncharacterized protein (UPF0548 family)